MKEINKSSLRFILTATFLAIVFIKAMGQAVAPDPLTTGTLKDQLNFIEERTRIYENYRAIREDMFQKMKKNILDTLTISRGEIIRLKNTSAISTQKIDSLNRAIETTKTSLNEVTRSKNSIRVLGIDANKATYNSVMWMIVAGLAIILAIGFLWFKRNMSVTLRLKNELSEQKTEFDAYRKSSREAREKMSMDHFNEIKRLKGDDSRFKIQDSRFRIQDSRFKIQDSRFKIQDSRF